MSLTRDNFSRRYAVRLQEYLVVGSRTVLGKAVALGRQAVQLGLATLDLAQIHHGALDTLGTTCKAAARLRRRAQRFFNEVQTSLVEQQPAVLQFHQEANQFEGQLRVRKGQLAAAQLRLQKGLLKRRTLEAKLRKAGTQFVQLQQSSANKEASLRHLTHELMLAHEEERRLVRGQLQDKIGQTLLGIGIQLLNLKRELVSEEENLLIGIATTAELVVKCLKPGGAALAA